MGSGIGVLGLTPAVLAAGAMSLAAAQAQDASSQTPSPTSAPPVQGAASPDATTAAPASPAAGPASPANAAPTDEDQADNSDASAAPSPPPSPPTPQRAPAAVLRVLDKVTAETMAFEAPVGQRVRYKSLIFEVKACETRGPSDPQPQPSAYIVITTDAGLGASGVAGPRQLYKGWMFANAPGVHALTHPIYDAWLVACSAAAPPT